MPKPALAEPAQPAPLVVLPRFGAQEPPKDLIERVCQERSITVETLLGRDTSRWTVAARRDVARVLHARGMSLRQIGAVLGGRDHSTIGHLLRKGR